MVGDRTLVFTVTGLGGIESEAFPMSPGPPMFIAEFGGNDQTGPVGTELVKAFSVKVTDSFGNAVEGVIVTWTVTSGLGALSADTSYTDSDGIASTFYILGGSPGVETVQAESTGAIRVPSFPVTPLNQRLSRSLPSQSRKTGGCRVGCY